MRPLTSRALGFGKQFGGQLGSTIARQLGATPLRHSQRVEIMLVELANDSSGRLARPSNREVRWEDRVGGDSALAWKPAEAATRCDALLIFWM